MILLFSLIVISSFLSFGVFIATQEDMIAERLGVWAEKQGNWTKPIFTCIWCMPSVYSVIAICVARWIGVVHEFDWILMGYYPIVVGGASILNGLLWSLIEFLVSNTKNDTT